MKRDIKINYGKIEDIISNIIKYDGALNDMEASLKYIKAEINNSTGESIDSLLDNYELLIKNIGICKEELNDLRKILSDYINEMSGYAQAIHRGSLIRVDRNDVWWNIKSMEGIINQITDEQMRWGYNYSGSWSSDKDVIRREEHNARQIDSINHIVEKYVNKLNGKIQEIYAIHNSKVIPFENTDDAFRDRAWNMYWKCTGLGDWVGDFFGFLDKSFNNIIDGVLKGLTDLVVGLAQLAIGAVEYVGSCAVVVLCEPFGGAPDWAKNKVNEDNELILSILKDPALIIEGIAQDASDAVDEKGICYSAGYLGGTFLGTKGLDKIAKGVKGLISGTETGTIKTLEQGATQALKSIKDILNKAGNKSIEQLDKIITKVYSRVNGVLDVEVAGYGRIRIKESSILDDVDKICKDRYVKWIEGKSSEGVTQAERIIPGTPGIVTGGSSTKLGKNIMESIGLKRSTKWTGHQAQHIIPAEMADNPIIKKMGMDLDNATNGILLRTPDAELSAMSRHRGYHSVYNDVVRNELNKLNINQSVDVLQKQVFDLQSDLRRLQESGLPLYPSQGATVDLWERNLSKIRK
ncbi:AHH domain-containing protein [Clostridium sporogenes]|uniref:AHH domain-containing protein n=3 Tax=Clostridium sporogenes TaxID=1509 RepID=UPI00196A1306|nr:AHH domain-containing protein [Clostridium sporogenes]MCW6106996.1 AHH domain-containing protein [Clostridium sporogenes]